MAEAAVEMIDDLIGNRMRLTNHHITEEEYLERLRAQDYACKICRRKFRKVPHIDHDHDCCPGSSSCGWCIRGLLCATCNSTILGRALQEGNLGREHALRVVDNLRAYVLNKGEIPEMDLPEAWGDEILPTAWLN